MLKSHKILSQQVYAKTIIKNDKDEKTLTEILQT